MAGARNRALADGLAVAQLGALPFDIVTRVVDRVVTVDEASIALAILRLIELEKSVVEGGGAAPLAAFLGGRLDSLKGKRVVLVLAGGNIDSSALGRVIEVVSGKSLGAFLTERILAPLQMAETAFHTGEANAARLAEPFPTDPWTGEKVQLFNMLEKPVMESGGGGLVSTTMDYARFSQMLLNGGALDGIRIVGRKTLQLMASDHLGPHVKVNSPLMPAGHGFGLGFAVRTHQGMAPFLGSQGQFFWSGMAGTFFFIDPAEDLFTVFMMQGPGQREYIRSMLRDLVYAAVE